MRYLLTGKYNTRGAEGQEKFFLSFRLAKLGFFLGLLERPSENLKQEGAMRVVNTVGIKNQANKILKWDLKSPTVTHMARGFGSKV